MFVPLLSDYPRRRSAFSPASLSGLALWLKADAGLFQDVAGTTPAVADADPVGLWQDQSGNSRHASQATASKRPTLKLAIQNGKPVIRCDGVDDFLSYTNPGYGTTHSVLIAASPKALAGTVLHGADSGAGDWSPLLNPTTLNYRAASTATASATHGFTAGNFYLFGLTRSGTALQFLKNGGNLGTPQTLAANNVLNGGGLAGYSNGLAVSQVDIGEVLIFTSNVTSSLPALWTYLNGRWGAF